MAEETLTRLLSKLLKREVPEVAGEAIACEHLQRNGFKILDRNYRCRSGEVDVVARHGDATVFVEVKQHHGEALCEDHQAVTFGKRRRLIRAARLYAASHGLSETPIRFDVISLDWAVEAKPGIRHDQDAFESDGI